MGWEGKCAECIDKKKPSAMQLLTKWETAAWSCGLISRRFVCSSEEQPQAAEMARGQDS